MADPKPTHVVKTNQVPWEPGMTRGRYENQRKGLGGLDVLRCGLWQLPPGKKSFPLHRHHGSDEALFVLSGTATVRTTDGDIAIGPGDYVAFPAGGAAHQLVNDGTEPLVYFAASANPFAMECVEYPDSGKVATVIGRPPDIKRFNFREATQVDYFDGDPDA